ncbi:MAG TPA: hypothetical protein VEW26_06155 [Allosphingosinicella sp.]|nr:hypothetical protein [Allosphingosinicella sp.]
MGQLVCKSEKTAAAAAAAVTPAVLAARLFTDGPQILPADSRHFALQGFARNGWPVAVDFQPQPGTLTVLVVTPYGPAPSSSPARRGLKAVRDSAGPVRIVMDPTGRGGRQLFVLPRIAFASAQGPGGGELGIATYSVESYRISAKGKPSVKRSPVEIFGFGAGPDAVPGRLAGQAGRAPAMAAAALVLTAAQSSPAAMALSQAVLADRATTVTRRGSPPQRRVDYQYRVGRSLHLVAEDIWRESGGKAVPVLLGPRLRNPAPATIRNFWALAGNPGAVQYRLVVRGWQQCPNGDFTTCANQAAFGVARSAAVRVK